MTRPCLNTVPRQVLYLLVFVGALLLPSASAASSAELQPTHSIEHCLRRPGTEPEALNPNYHLVITVPVVQNDGGVFLAELDDFMRQWKAKVETSQPLGTADKDSEYLNIKLMGQEVSAGNCDAQKLAQEYWGAQVFEWLSREKAKINRLEMVEFPRFSNGLPKNLPNSPDMESANPNEPYGFTLRSLTTDARNSPLLWLICERTQHQSYEVLFVRKQPEDTSQPKDAADPHLHCQSSPHGQEA